MRNQYGSFANKKRESILKKGFSKASDKISNVMSFEKNDLKPIYSPSLQELFNKDDNTSYIQSSICNLCNTMDCIDRIFPKVEFILELEERINDYIESNYSIIQVDSLEDSKLNYTFNNELQKSIFDNYINCLDLSIIHVNDNNYELKSSNLYATLSNIAFIKKTIIDELEFFFKKNLSNNRKFTLEEINVNFLNNIYLQLECSNNNIFKMLQESKCLDTIEKELTSLVEQNLESKDSISIVIKNLPESKIQEIAALLNTSVIFNSDSMMLNIYNANHSLTRVASLRSDLTKKVKLELKNLV